jgi:hypothetical protein
LVGVQRSTARYQSQPRTDEADTVALIREYAHEQPMYGYRIIAALLRQDGHAINRKRVYRIWRQEGLQLPRRKTGKRRFGDSTGYLRRASRPNEVWTYDFLEARTERGGKLRILTILDEYTRECLTIHVARSISSRQVIQQLEWLFLLRGARTTSAVTMARSSSPMPFSNGYGIVTVTPCISSPAVLGRTPSLRVSMAHFAVNVSIAGSLPMGMKLRW